jgi:predicted transcriptional regulator YheO
MYATHQISKGQRDFLNRELERQERKIDEKTVVVFDVGEKQKRTAEMKELTAAIEEKGGRAIFVNSLAMDKSDYEQAKREVEKAREAQEAQQRQEAERQAREQQRQQAEQQRQQAEQQRQAEEQRQQQERSR